MKKRTKTSCKNVPRYMRNAIETERRVGGIEVDGKSTAPDSVAGINEKVQIRVRLLHSDSRFIYSTYIVTRMPARGQCDQQRAAWVEKLDLSAAAPQTLITR